MPSPTRLRVRYHECDAQGIVFNANYFAFFDVALTELWRERFGSYESLVEAASDVAVRDAQATLPRSRPLRRGDRAGGEPSPGSAPPRWS